MAWRGLVRCGSDLGCGKAWRGKVWLGAVWLGLLRLLLLGVRSGTVVSHEVGRGMVWPGMAGCG